MRAQQAILGGVIETMDSTSRRATSAAVAQGRFIAVGDEAEVRAVCGPTTEVIDLDGRTVLPGFIDTHLHLEKIAREMAMIHLESVRTIRELLDRVDSAARGAPSGEWIRSFGNDGAWHERSLTEGRLPTRQELDAVSPENPVFLYRGPDAAALNTAAARALAALLGNVSGDSWRETDGLLRGPAARELEAELPPASPQRELDALAEASQRLLRMGVTTVVDPGLAAAFARTWRLYERARERGGLRQRVYLMNRLDPRRPLAEELERVLAGPALPGDGDEHQRAWSVKILLDGEFENAWLRPGERVRGKTLRRYTVEELKTVLEICAQHRWPMCVHAMGGGAIGCVVAAVADAVRRGCSFTPAQISIAHAFLASRGDVEECARLGIALSVQPLLAYVFEEEMLTAWGELAESANPIATMIDCRANVSGGSDTLPCEPLRGARYAVDRCARNGTVLGAAEAITPRDAISLFSSRASGYLQRDDIGVIAPGAVADYTIWDANPLDVNTVRWPNLRASSAVVAGVAAFGP